VQILSLDLDPDPGLDPSQHSSKRLDPDSHIMNADPDPLDTRFTTTLNKFIPTYP
jgi:hypothetical protein